MTICHLRQPRLLLSLVSLMMMSLVACGSSTSNAVMPTTRAITFSGAGGVTLAGTLLIPTHPDNRRVPGVVIVVGSGPLDRDGNEPQAHITTDLYRQIAEQLAQHGIASLRYDKRGVGASSLYPSILDPAHPTPNEVTAFQQFLAWSNYIADATAALGFLQQQPEIAAQHTAFIGHSEGTKLVEAATAALSTTLHPPAALVLLGAPGRTADDLFRWQITNSLQRTHVDETTTTFVLTQYDALVAGVKAQGVILSPPLAALRANTHVPPAVLQGIVASFTPYTLIFLQGDYQTNPVALVATLPQPVLLIQGETDHNVSSTLDTPLLDAALKQRTPDDHQTLLIPNASHFFKAVQASEDLGYAGPVIPQLTDTIVAWLSMKLAVSA